MSDPEAESKNDPPLPQKENRPLWEKLLRWFGILWMVLIIIFFLFVVSVVLFVYLGLKKAGWL